MEISQKHLKLISEALSAYSLDLMFSAAKLEETMMTKVGFWDDEAKRLFDESMTKSAEADTLKALIDELILRE